MYIMKQPKQVELNQLLNEQRTEKRSIAFPPTLYAIIQQSALRNCRSVAQELLYRVSGTLTSNDLENV